MLIISKRALIFFGAGTDQKIQIEPKSRPQSVPDWVRDDLTFQTAVRAGLACEVRMPPPPVESAETATN